MNLEIIVIGMLVYGLPLLVVGYGLRWMRDVARDIRAIRRQMDLMGERNLTSTE